MRTKLAVLLLCWCAMIGLCGLAAGQTQQYVITGCPKDGTVLRGDNRLDADVNSGVTIWTMPEWDQALRARALVERYRNPPEPSISDVDGQIPEKPQQITFIFPEDEQPLVVPAIMKVTHKAGDRYWCDRESLCYAWMDIVEWHCADPDNHVPLTTESGKHVCLKVN